MAMNILYVHDSTSLSNCPKCDLIVYRIDVGTSNEHAELYAGDTHALLCQSQISWDAIAGTISDKTGSKIIDCFSKNLSTYTLSADMIGKWYMHTGADDTTKTPALYKNAWYQVKSDGGTPPTLSLERISTIVDDTTIEKNTDNKYQIKDLAITVSKLADNAVETAKIKDGNVTKAKIDSAANVVYTEDTQILKNKEMSGDDNNFYDLETGVFKAGQIITKEDTGYLPEDDGKLVGAWRLKNELAAKDITLEKQATAETGYIATYVLKKGGVELTPKINIPKDFLVKSAKVSTVVNYAVATAYSKLDLINDDLTNTWVVKADITAEGNTGIDAVQKALLSTKRTTGDKFLVFEINVKEGTADSEFLFIDVKDLVDVYTGSDTIDISTANVISVKDNSITLAKLANATSANKGKTAVVGDDGAWIYGKFMKFVDVTAYPTSNIDDEVLYRKSTSNKIKQYNLTAEASLDYIITTAGIEHVGFETTSWADVTANWDSTWASKFVEAENGEVTKYSTTSGIAYIDTASFTETTKCEVQYHKNNAWYKMGKPSVDNTTIEENDEEKLQVKDGGISTAKIADNAITTAKITDGNITKVKIDTNAKVVFTEDTQTLKSKTISADDNTLQNITGTNFKAQTAADAKKTYVWNGTAWVLGKAGTDVDNVTIEESSDKLQVKEGGIEAKHLKSNIAGTNITLDSTNNVLTSMPVTVVQTLPTTGQSQKQLFKLESTNAVYWWNGTEWVDISSKSGMVEVTEFPTGSDIQQKLLYKLTQDIKHESGTYTYTMDTQTFTEGTTDPTPTAIGQIFHNTSTSSWKIAKQGTTAIEWESLTVNAVVTFPEPAENIANNYYYDGTTLKKCNKNPVYVYDYYAGVYVYINGWKALYTTNQMIDYNNGIKDDTYPVIGSTKVKGAHSITDFGGLTQVVADASYLFKTIQPSEIPEGYTSNTLLGLINEMIAKFSTAIRMAGNCNFFSDLPDNPSAGDLWSIKYKWSPDYTTNYGHQRQKYYTSTTPVAGRITHNADLDTWYNGLTEITVNNVATLPTATAATVGTYYFCNNVLYLDSVGKYIESTNNWCWNGLQWFLYGSGEIDMTMYEKITDYSDKLQAANPTQDTTGSHLKANSVNKYLKVVSTLTTPITDIKSTDHLIFTMPNEVTIEDQPCAGLKVLTHAGQFTAMENVAELPTGSGVADYIKSLDLTKLIHKYSFQENNFTEAAGHTGVGYEHDTSNSKWYKDGTEITVTTIGTITASEDTVGKYYIITTNPTKLCLGIDTLGVEQDFNLITGDLMWDKAGSIPSTKTKETLMTTISGGETAISYQLKTDGSYGFNKIGTVTETSPITQEVPVWEVIPITLTGNETYMADCAKAESGLNVNAAGVYGHYSISESLTSKKYSQHKGNGLGREHGFDGTVTFTPSSNTANWQTVNKAYWSGNKLYCQGDITIDKIILSETL